jgi:hypothetical protein
MERPLPSIEFGDGGVADGSIAGLRELRLAGSTIHEAGLPESGCSPPAPCAPMLHPNQILRFCGAVFVITQPVYGSAHNRCASHYYLFAAT